MKNKRKTLASWAVIVVFVLAGIALFYYGNIPTKPKVGADGKISGNYSIAGVMRLGKPYKCSFEKRDETSKIAGTLYTDSKNIYGEFRVKTAVQSGEFNTYLIIKNNESYVWTSLANIGYKSPAVKRATKNASAQEQMQIVGTRDKMPFSCELWTDSANFSFEPPTWVTFSELK